jgi:hypothetical protein
LGAVANFGQKGLQVIVSVSIPGVPDPAIWMTMMLGFGVLGMALRGVRHSAVSKTIARS